MTSNTETIPGFKITKSLGVATGSTVRAKHIGKDILAGFKNIVGGEIKAYTELLMEARTEALGRMMLDAAQRGGNAVVNVRFATSSVAGGAAELFAYGTAVVVEQSDFMSEFLNSTPLWLLILYGIVFLFSAFFPAAFIYSMLFGWLHESKRTKKLISKRTENRRKSLAAIMFTPFLAQ